MPSFAKDLGAVPSHERLYGARLGPAAKRVLSAVEAQPSGVTATALVARTVLPLSVVLGSLVELESAGLVRVHRPDGSHLIEAQPVIQL